MSAIYRSRAPLRLGLGRGGTDVSPYSDEYGGCVLNATVNLYSFCTIQPTLEPFVTFNATDRNERFSVSATPIIPLEGKLLLHKAVYNYVVATFNNNFWSGYPSRVTQTGPYG